MQITHSVCSCSLTIVAEAAEVAAPVMEAVGETTAKEEAVVKEEAEASSSQVSLVVGGGGGDQDFFFSGGEGGADGILTVRPVSPTERWSVDLLPSRRRVFSAALSCSSR